MLNYDRQQLRRFIQNAFSDEELGNFCFDYFPQVYNEFTTGMPKSQKVRMLVAHAENGSRLPDLHASLKRENPGAYDNAFPEEDTPAQSESLQFIPRNPRQIFISYASVDADFAYRLAADVRMQGWQTWIAPDSIRPGEKWVEAINRGLAESGVFLLALTESAVNSRWVQTETNAAIGMEHRGEIRFLPISLGDVDAPAVWQAYQWIPFGEDYKLGLENLLSILQPDEMAEMRHLYNQFQKAIEKEEWPQVEDLGGQIQTKYPDYRDTVRLLDETRQQVAQERLRQAKADRLYSQLQGALTNQNWEEALNLAEQIQQIKPPIWNVDDLAAEARQGQLDQQEKERHQARLAEAERLYPHLEEAIAAESWDKALELVKQIEVEVKDFRDVSRLGQIAQQKQREERRRQRRERFPLRQWLRSLPPITWAGVVGVLSVALLVIFWPDAFTFTVDPNVPPADAELGDTWTRPKDDMVMVYVPPPDAPFVLESGVDTPTEGYWIDKYEVSNAQYQLCVDAGVCEPSEYVDDGNFNGTEYPVVGMSAFDADAYSAWVGGALPTEAEWEYAYVGNFGFEYPWGDEFDGTPLNCYFGCNDGYKYTAPVDSFPDGASWVGALNMAGNVWEWTASWWDESEDYRVYRGASWNEDASYARAAIRYYSPPDYGFNRHGFRVVVRRPPSLTTETIVPQLAIEMPTVTQTADPIGPPAEAELGDTWTRPKDEMVMVYVPPPDVSFVLKSGVDAPTEGYWIDKYEVSNAQYQLCVDAGVCEPSIHTNDAYFNGAEYPVVGVSAFEAEAYSAWVGGMLPTEAEWEYAALGDSGFQYPWGNEFDGTRLNCGEGCNDDYQYTAPVDNFLDGISWVGVFNMAGNVWEWTASRWDETDDSRVLRGGSWYDFRLGARATERYFYHPDSRRFDLGFRVVVRHSPSS